MLPELNLRQDLVGKGARHHKGRVASGATEVEQSARGKHDDSVAVWELIAVHLLLDIHLLDAWVPLEACHVNFIIEMPDISNDGIIFHLGH